MATIGSANPVAHSVTTFGARREIELQRTLHVEGGKSVQGGFHLPDRRREVAIGDGTLLVVAADGVLDPRLHLAGRACDERMAPAVIGVDAVVEIDMIADPFGNLASALLLDGSARAFSRAPIVDEQIAVIRALHVVEQALRDQFVVQRDHAGETVFGLREPHHPDAGVIVAIDVLLLQPAGLLHARA